MKKGACRLSTVFCCLSLVACLLSLSSGCAELQGYHPASYNLVRPGTGSARVEYQSVAGFVNGDTTTPEQAIGAISRANMNDSQAWVLRECFSRYGWRCNMWGYGYGNRYSRPGYTLGGVEAVEGWRAGQHGARLAGEALRGAKLSADLTLRQSDVLERALGRTKKSDKTNGTDRSSSTDRTEPINRINKTDRTDSLPPQCKDDCEKCGTCTRFWQ